MTKGGYQIINLKNHEFTLENGNFVIEGIYDKIESTRKVILLSGLNFEGREYHDMFVLPLVSGSNYVIRIGSTIVTIQDNDVVNVSEE